MTEQTENQCVPELTDKFVYPVSDVFSPLLFSHTECEKPVILSSEFENTTKEGFIATINLQYMWLKSSSPIQETFSLSFIYPPLGIIDTPVICQAKPDPSINSGDCKRICTIIYDGKWTEIINSNQILNTLQDKFLTIEIRYFKNQLKQLPHFAFVQIPIGDIFSRIQLESNLCGGSLSGNAHVIKIKSNREFGHVNFVVTLEKINNWENTTFTEIKKPKEENANVNSTSVQNRAKTVLDISSQQEQEERIIKLINPKIYRTAIEEEIGRLVKKRYDLLVSQAYIQSDVIIRCIDKQLELLANQLNSI